MYITSWSILLLFLSFIFQEKHDLWVMMDTSFNKYPTMHFLEDIQQSFSMVEIVLLLFCFREIDSQDCIDFNCIMSNWFMINVFLGQNNVGSTSEPSCIEAGFRGKICISTGLCASFRCCVSSYSIFKVRAYISFKILANTF